MNNKLYVVEYYMDYETHGIHAIFNNKSEAEKCAETMTKRHAELDIDYTAHEEVLYSTFDEWEAG